VTTDVPGVAPVPRQVSQISFLFRSIVLSMPVNASGREMEISHFRLAPRFRPERPERPDDWNPKMSPKI